MMSGRCNSIRAERSRLATAVRCGTGLIGGYVAAAGLAMLAARLLPFARAEATAWAMIFSFLLYAALGLWAFHERRLGKVTIVIWGAALVSAGAILILGLRP